MMVTVQGVLWSFGVGIQTGRGCREARAREGDTLSTNGESCGRMAYKAWKGCLGTGADLQPWASNRAEEENRQARPGTRAVTERSREETVT